MAKLIYATISSLDGYVADEAGNFDWAAPSEEVHAFVNDLERPIGTYLYGRRMYEVMAYWQTASTGPEEHPIAADFARIWRGADKVVYSTTLTAVATPRTRLETNFDIDAVRRLKATADRDLSIGGPNLAAHAIAAGLVDEYHFFLTPIVIGGGTASLPAGARGAHAARRAPLRQRHGPPPLPRGRVTAGEEVPPLLADEPDHLLNAFGMRRVEDPESGPALEMPLAASVRNPHGGLHGGLMMVLIECGAAGIAVRAAGSENIVAGDLTVRFLAAVQVGPARVVGRALHTGRRSIVVQADVIDIGADRALCASATVGYARFDDRPAEPASS